MVTLEQIRQLDARVHRAVELIGKLRDENNTLKNRLSEYQGRIEELEVLISNFKEDQSEIEHGITSALTQLATIDDSGKPVTQTKERREEETPQKKRESPQLEQDEEQGDVVDENEEDPDAELDIF
jgi:chromosome segregation ATPase